MPSRYILKRSKSAKCDRVTDDGGMEISDFPDKSLLRCTRLFQLASNVIENALFNEDASKIVDDDLHKLLEKIKSYVDCGSTSETYNITPVSSVQVFNEPLAVRAKGYGK